MGKSGLTHFFLSWHSLICFSQGAKGNVGAPGSRGEPGFPVSYPTNISYLKQIKFAFVFTIILCNSFKKGWRWFLNLPQSNKRESESGLAHFSRLTLTSVMFLIGWSILKLVPETGMVTLFFTLRQTQQKTHLRIVCLELNKKSINLFNRDFSSFQGLEGSAGISGEAGHSGNQVRRTL